MTSDPSGCNNDCLATVLQKGPSKGSYISVGDGKDEHGESFQTYVSLPPALSSVEEARGGWNKIIFWAADVYGARYINNQLLMDYHASKGYLVLSPDYFFGDELSTHVGKEGFDLMAWIKQRPVDASLKLLNRWVKAVKEEFGTKDTRYGVIGFCYGGPLVMDLICSDEVSAGCIVHPAFIPESYPFHNVRQPLHMSLAEQDSHFPRATLNKAILELTKLSTPAAPNGDLEASRAEELGKGGVNWSMQMFGGVVHGWALRGDLSVKRIRYAREESAKSCLRWWSEYLGGEDANE